MTDLPVFRRAVLLAACLAALTSLTPTSHVGAQTGTEEGTGRSPIRAPSAMSLQPGIGLGVSVGAQGFGGSANRWVQPGGRADVSIRYGTASGLLIHAGALVGRNALDSATSRIDAHGFYVEPRYAWLNLSSRWAPFVSGHLALNRERVRGPRVVFNASGYSLAGGGGAFYRLTPQLALEGGLSVGLFSAGDYTYRGDQQAYFCVEGLERGTPLPQTAVECGGLDPGRPLYTCYPPFSERLGGDCDPPTITRVDSRRSASWYRLWVGLHLSLGRRPTPNDAAVEWCGGVWQIQVTNYLSERARVFYRAGNELLGTVSPGETQVFSLSPAVTLFPEEPPYVQVESETGNDRWRSRRRGADSAEALDVATHNSPNFDVTISCSHVPP